MTPYSGFAYGVQRGLGSPLSNHAGELLHAQFAQQRLSGGLVHQPALGPNIRINERLPQEMAEWLRKIHEPGEPPFSTPPPPMLYNVVANTGSIVFHNGVPVSGWAGLSLFPDGKYNFSGHFHDAGFPSYHYALVWMVRSQRGTAFVWQRNRRLHGTIEPGERHDHWNESGRHGEIAKAWNELAAGYAWHWEAAVNLEVRELIEQAEAALGIVREVIELPESIEYRVPSECRGNSTTED